MNIVNISIKDMAGVGYYLCKLLNEKTDYKCRQVSDRPHFHPVDIYWRENKELVKKLIEEADVLHINSPAINFGRGLYHKYPFPIDLSKYIGKKKIIAHYHGWDLTRIPDITKYFSKMKRRKIDCFVSTPELLSIHPYLKWLPSPVNLDLKPLPLEKRNKKLTVFHATVYKHRKDAPFMKELMKKFPDIKYEPTYGRYDYNEMIEKMSKAHILFNHFYPFYGVATIEGSMLGLYVLTGLNKKTFKYIPDYQFLPVTKENIEKLLINISTALTKRNIYSKGMRCRNFILRHHCKKTIEVIKCSIQKD